MHKLQLILMCTPFAIACMPVIAQQAMSVEDEFVIPAILLEQHEMDIDRKHSTLEAISLGQLSQLRSAGIDPSWITDRFQIPSFDPNSLRRVTQGDHPLTVESWATHHGNHRGVHLNDSVSFSVGRTTELRDGNISGSEGTLDNDSDRDHVASLAQSEGEYDLYDLSLEWEAVQAGPVTVSVLSGLKAIEANIGKRVTKNGSTSIDTVHRFTALPMIGSGVRWEVSDTLSFSGAALTHPIDAGDALIDFNASTDLQLSNNVGLSAGYRIIRSSFEVGSLDTEVKQEGLFARLQISF